MQRGITILLACLFLFTTQADAAPRARNPQKTKVTRAAKAKTKAKTKSVGRTRKSPASPVALLGKRSELASVRALSTKEHRAKSLRLPPLKLQTRTAKSLKYLREGISAKQITKIQKVVDRLAADSSKGIIVFRGQEKRTKTVESEVMREHSISDSVHEFNRAAKSESERAASDIAQIHAKRFPSKYQQGRAEHLKSVTGAQLLAIRGQLQLSSPYLVATTRDLATAFGNFYKAPKIRYIYILQVPREHTINTHGLVSAKMKALNLSPNGNQSEKEISIPLRATEYVRAIYDIKADKIITQ